MGDDDDDKGNLGVTANTFFVLRVPLTLAEACAADARQREQRQQFQARAPPASRLAPVNPYVQDPTVTAERLARRRKFEILQFPATRMRAWSRLVDLRPGIAGVQRFTSRVSRPLTGPGAMFGYTECDASGAGAGPFALSAADLALPLHPAPQASGAFADVLPKRLAVLYTTEVPASRPVSAFTPAPANDPLTGTNPCTWAMLRFQRAAANTLRRFVQVTMRVPLGIELRGQLPAALLGGGIANTLVAQPRRVTVACLVALYFNDICVLRTESRTRTVVLRMDRAPNTSISDAEGRKFTLRKLFGVLTFTVAHFMLPTDAILTARVELVAPVVYDAGIIGAGGDRLSHAELIVNLAPGWRDSVAPVSFADLLDLTDPPPEESLTTASTTLDTVTWQIGGPPVVVAEPVEEFF